MFSWFSSDLESGIRFFWLLLGEDRMPLWYPTFFCTIHGRNAAKAASTLQATLYHVRDLLDWLDQRRVDLAARALAGRLDVLATAEIESLADALGRRRSLQTALDTKQKRERARSGKQVNLDVKYNRISDVATYLQWFIPRFADDPRCFSKELQAATRSIAEHLRELRPLRSRFRRIR